MVWDLSDGSSAIWSGPSEPGPQANRAHYKAKTLIVSLVDVSAQIKEAHNSAHVSRTQQTEQYPQGLTNLN